MMAMTLLITMGIAIVIAGPMAIISGTSPGSLGAGGGSISTVSVSRTSMFLGDL